MSHSNRNLFTLILAVGLALFVWGAVYAWSISVGAGYIYPDQEAPHQVQASVRFAYFVFYVSVIGALSQIAGLIFLWRDTIGRAAPDRG